MKRIDCVQGDLVWAASRLGLPTASRFSEIITPGTMKPSKSADKYLAELVAEWMLGRPVDDASSSFMDRGSGMEEDAVAQYELDHDVDVDRVGFLTLDDGSAGASPDGLVGDDGGLEIKCLAAKTHVLHLLDPLSDEFKAQIQGGLLISDREWWDRLYYHPTFPKVERRYGRDEVFIKALRPALSEFTERLAESKARILAMGYVPVPPEVAMGSPKQALNVPADVLA